MCALRKLVADIKIGQMTQVQTFTPKEIHKWYVSEGIIINTVTTHAEKWRREKCMQIEQLEQNNDEAIIGENNRVEM